MGADAIISRAVMDTRAYAVSRPLRLGLNAVRARRAGLPTHHEKRSQVVHEARRYGLRTLVETGTYLGDMIWSTRGSFDRVYSIELDRDLAARASRLFTGDARIEILAGDSGELLPGVLERLEGPALFWLDAHYSGGITAGGEADAPILRELGHVLEDDPRHVVLIDDARLFDGTDGYPTVAAVEALAASAPAPRRVVRRGDILVLEPVA